MTPVNRVVQLFLAYLTFTWLYLSSQIPKITGNSFRFIIHQFQFSTGNTDLQRAITARDLSPQVWTKSQILEVYTLWGKMNMLK